MEFPPGFYFYLSFAFSFFLPSILNPSIYPSFFFFFFFSFSFLLLLLIIIIIVVAVIVVFILLYSTVLFFHIPQMDFKSLYRYMYFPDGYAERSNK